MEIPIYFNYSIGDIKNIEKEIINSNKLWINTIKKEIKNKRISPKQFLESFLYNSSQFDYIVESIIFLQEVSPNKELRDASANFQINLDKYFINFYSSKKNYNLFLILKKLKIDYSFNGKDINNTKKLIKNIFKRFKDNGIELSSKKRKLFIKIKNTINKKEQLFSKNIANGTKHINFRIDELDGISKVELQLHKKEFKNKSNQYKFNTSYPDQSLILKNCSNLETRKKIYILCETVGKENINILHKILELKYKNSRIFNFNNTVSYYFYDNRIATYKKVKDLVKKLIPILKKKAANEYQNLLKLSSKSELYDYDIAYYSNLYKKKYLDINENIIMQYFPSNYSIPLIFDIFGKLFGIKISKIDIEDKNIVSKEYYWDSEVKLYKIIQSDKEEKKTDVIGYLYLDLYPREGKFTHAATFSLQNSYYNEYNKRVLPVTSVVCNFSPPNKNKEYSLLKFSEVVTFCHEMGHAFNNLFSKVKYEGLSGITMEDDFVEAPSQFLENWCYEPTFLKKISKNHETGKQLPYSIIKNIIKNKNYNCGIHYLTQILYIKYDLMIHKMTLKNLSKEYLYKLWYSLHNNLLPFKITKNIYPMCSFGHLVGGYSSGYYGYLWSIIYSYDIFSEFKKHGIYNKELGLKYRKEVLEKGGTISGMKMLENFLNRETNQKEFMKIFEENLT
jgi:Zn-dependent oligopeptidase